MQRRSLFAPSPEQPIGHAADEATAGRFHQMIGAMRHKDGDGERHQGVERMIRLRASVVERKLAVKA